MLIEKWTLFHFTEPIHLLSDNYMHSLNCNISTNVYYYIYTLQISFSLGHTASSIFWPYDKFVWRAFSSWTKALMHIPCVKWVRLLPEESCTVKTSLVVTHYMFIVFYHCYIQVEFCWICLSFVGLFNEVWLMPSFALLKWSLAY